MNQTIQHSHNIKLLSTSSAPLVGWCCSLPAISFVRAVCVLYYELCRLAKGQILSNNFSYSLSAIFFIWLFPATVHFSLALFFSSLPLSLWDFLQHFAILTFMRRTKIGWSFRSSLQFSFSSLCVYAGNLLLTSQHSSPMNREKNWIFELALLSCSQRTWQIYESGIFTSSKTC